MLYGTIYFGNETSTLVIINSKTGELIEIIGEIGYVVNGMIYDDQSGTLYACTSYNDNNYFGLITINLDTGAGSKVNTNGWATYRESGITNITLDSNSNMYAWTEDEDDLLSVNKSTGVETLIGESNLSTYAYGLDFDKNEILYLVNGDGDYYSINTDTGNSIAAGNIQTTAHHGAFHPKSNIWYGIDKFETKGSRQLVLANLTNGTIIERIRTIDNLHTIAFFSYNFSPQFFRLNESLMLEKIHDHVVIDSNVTISDVNLDEINNYNGSKLTISRNGGANSNDIFGSSGRLSELIEGNALILNDIIVGTVTSNSNGILELSFNNNATSARLNETIQSITYLNELLLPRETIVLEYNFNDGNSNEEQGIGGTKSVKQTVSITIIDYYSLPTVNDYGLLLFTLIIMFSAICMIRNNRKEKLFFEKW